MGMKETASTMVINKQGKGLRDTALLALNLLADEISKDGVEGGKSSTFAMGSRRFVGIKGGQAWATKLGSDGKAGNERYYWSIPGNQEDALKLVKDLHDAVASGEFDEEIKACKRGGLKKAA